MILIMLGILLLNAACAEPIVYSDRYVKIKQAEQAIREKYQIVPDMYTFFVRGQYRDVILPMVVLRLFDALL